MKHHSFHYEPNGPVVNITFTRVKERNTISQKFLEELREALDIIESDSQVKAIVFRSAGPDFCSGMDFGEISQKRGSMLMRKASSLYFDLLQRFTSSSKIFIAVVNGRVNAGGVGLVSACDLIIAGNRASFSLSEALFGLIPANVLPFLSRRVGFQKAYWMSLTTHPVDANLAWKMGLADVYGEDTEELLRKQLLRVLKVSPDAVKRLKTYATRLSEIDGEVKKEAMLVLDEMSEDQTIHTNIKDFIENGVSPWEK